MEPFFLGSLPAEELSKAPVATVTLIAQRFPIGRGHGDLYLNEAIALEELLSGKSRCMSKGAVECYQRHNRGPGPLAKSVIGGMKCHATAG